MCVGITVRPIRGIQLTGSVGLRSPGLRAGEVNRIALTERVVPRIQTRQFTAGNVQRAVAEERIVSDGQTAARLLVGQAVCRTDMSNCQGTGIFQCRLIDRLKVVDCHICSCISPYDKFALIKLQRGGCNIPLLMSKLPAGNRHRARNVQSALIRPRANMNIPCIDCPGIGIGKRRLHG